MNMAAVAGLARCLRAGWGQVCVAGQSARSRGSRRLFSAMPSCTWGENVLWDNRTSTKGQMLCRWQHYGVPIESDPEMPAHKCSGSKAGDQIRKYANCVHHRKDPKEEERDFANQALSRLQSVEDPIDQEEAFAGSALSNKATESTRAEDPAQGSSVESPSTARTDDEDQVYAIQALERKVMSLERQLREAMIKHDTAVAEAENLRRRTQQIVVDAKQFGIHTFCRDLVAVADSLTKMAEDLAKESSAGLSLKDVSVGIANVEGELQAIFEKHGLTKIWPLGGLYTPYEHEIESHVPTTGLAPGTVVGVVRTGYRLHGRTLRYALVHVSMEGRVEPEGCGRIEQEGRVGPV